MNTRARCWLLTLLVLTACSAPDAEPADTAHELPRAAADAAAADSIVAAHATHDSVGARPVEGHGEEGAGLALRPIMQQLGTAMAALQHALWLGEDAEVEAQAAAIAAHAHISLEENARIARLLGAELAAFQAADEAVHQAALGLHEAARARDTDATLEELATVQRGCVACHARFRERLRTTD